MSGAFSAEIAKQAPNLMSSGGSLLGGSGGASGGMNLSTLGSLASLLGSSAGTAKQANDDKLTAEAYQAYQAYLNSVIKQMKQELEARAEKYDTKLQNQFNEAEPQFQNEANTQLPELAQIKQDVLDENTEAQRANRRQIEATMARQGVRGGQAAILENRALGEQSRDALRNINQLAYNEAANRQNARLNYYNQKALTPWSTMSNAYGNSMVGANNALSNAQGGVYGNAYNRAMQNYLNTQSQKKKSGFNWGGALSGAASGASMGSAAGPWGAVAGGVIGGVAGGLSK